MTSSPSLFLLILVVTATTTTTAIPADTIASASEILSNTNNHNAMSLILPLISAPLSLPSLPSATLFSPSNTAFSSVSGQPGLSLLKFHFCPRRYSPADLLSLSYGSLLPTLLNDSSLAVSSTVFDDFFSLNGVHIAVNHSPLFDDSHLIIYSVDSFFPPNSPLLDSVSALSPTHTSPDSPDCHLNSPRGAYWDASAALRTRGYSLMAGFLDVQVSQFGYGGGPVTVFAPKDEEMRGYFGNFDDWGSVFLRHVVGCQVSWAELNELKEGVILGTFLKGFGIKVGRNGVGSLVINQNFTVEFPDFYRGDKILVHGLSGVFTVPPRGEDGSVPANQEGGGHGGSYSTDHGEF
ncbi:hypothetical protein vseg_004748 [Gypsophila vaccaria]